MISKILKYSYNLTTTSINNIRFIPLKKIYRYNFCQHKPQNTDHNKQKPMVETSNFTQDKDKKDNDDDGYQSTSIGNYLLGISVIAMLLAYAMMQIQSIRSENTKNKNAPKKTIATGKADIGGEWQLTDTKGKLFSSKDLEGSYYLIYFGFTNCPDICPVSLTKLSKAIEKVRNSKQNKFLTIKSVFVSVDPDRDNAEKIQKFLSFFDENMIGVTGNSNNDPKLRQCMKKFKIYSSKVQFQDQQTIIKGRKSYTIDHTILTYLMNDENQYLIHLGANLGQHDMAKIISEKIQQNQYQKMKKLKS